MSIIPIASLSNWCMSTEELDSPKRLQASMFGSRSDISESSKSTRTLSASNSSLSTPKRTFTMSKVKLNEASKKPSDATGLPKSPSTKFAQQLVLSMADENIKVRGQISVRIYCRFCSLWNSPSYQTGQMTNGLSSCSISTLASWKSVSSVNIHFSKLVLVYQSKLSVKKTNSFCWTILQKAVCV